MKRIAALLFLILSVITCFAQTQIDPTYQIRWNLLSGSGAPSITCTQNGNYAIYPYGAEWGQSYQDTTNNVEYKCTTSGWAKNLPTTGGTLTGALNGTSASFSGTVAAGAPIALTSGGTGATTAAVAMDNFGLTFVDVRNAGAKCDGTTDDTTAIQAAISEAESGLIAGYAPAIYIPSGVCRISAALRLPSNLQVFGDGLAASVIQQTSTTANLFTVYNNGTTLPEYFFGGGVRDITLEGNGHTTKGTLLEIQNAGGYTLDNVMFYNHGGRGIEIGEVSERSKFTNIFMQYVRFPETLNGFEFHQVGVTIMSPGQAGDLVSSPLNSELPYYCFGVNCVNGYFPGPGGQAMVSASGNGTTQT